MGKDRRGEEILEREMQVWRLRVTGLTQWQVADRLGLTQAAVSKILDRVAKRLEQEFVEEARAYKVQQTGILEHVASEALSAWEKSKLDAETEVTVTGKTTGGGKEDGKEGSDRSRAQITRTREGQSGNPAHLQAAMKAMSDVRELWGLNSPTRQEHAGPGGGPIPITEVIVHLPAAEDTAPPAVTNGTGPLELVVDE